MFLWGWTEVERVELPPLSRGAPDGSSSERESQSNANKKPGLKAVFYDQTF